MDNVTIGLALVAGLLSFISPCVLPLVPAYIGYMGGRLTHQVSRQQAAGAPPAISATMRLQMLMHGAAFVSGFTFVFVLIGLLTTALSSVAGQYVGAFTEILGRVGGIVIIFFGLQFMGLMPRLFRWLRSKDRAPILDSRLFSLCAAIAASALIYWALLGELVLTLPVIAALLLGMYMGGAFAQPARFWLALMDRLQGALYSDTRADIGGGREGLLGSAFMGMVFSAGWTPCIGPLLGTILTVAATAGATSGDITQGMLLLGAYSIGLGIPFLITAMLMDGARGLLRRLQRHMRLIELFSGCLMILIGLLVASGRLQSLSQTFSRGEFADFTFRVEECGLGIFEGDLHLQHLGDCLAGVLLPVAINQSASLHFTSEAQMRQLLFHAEAGEQIDVEARGLAGGELELAIALSAPDDTVLARANTADSRQVDDKLYPMLALELAQDGLYRLSLRAEGLTGDARIRVKVREALPIQAASNPPAQTNNLISDLSALVSEIGAIGLEEGKRAPAFSTTTLDGQQLSLADLRGKVTLLNFWGTWCGPCRREMPEFQRAYDEWTGRGFEILAIAYNDSEAAMSEFRDEFELSFPMALDETGAINDLYAIQTRPSSYLLGKDGVILARHFGVLTQAQLDDLLAAALADG
ncbi:MAG: redoxin domain-containing protein [Chloroflexi bacterium]|nr:redoxin domain-containing protein [Chloroflexota bacterium]MCY3580990.1 redoxin domain-containing protein [Chloroflexota bacterium]MCY3715447.1 redoxin domain-containing protein [Chloroflexota bacterium]MDE2651143.1 redoxin domain-containing protein [Chloroflexota bacterium]